MKKNFVFPKMTILIVAVLILAIAVLLFFYKMKLVAFFMSLVVSCFFANSFFVEKRSFETTSFAQLKEDNRKKRNTVALITVIFTVITLGIFLFL